MGKTFGFECNSYRHVMGKFEERNSKPRMKNEIPRTKDETKSRQSTKLGAEAHLFRPWNFVLRSSFEASRFRSSNFPQPYIVFNTTIPVPAIELSDDPF